MLIAIVGKLDRWEENKNLSLFSFDTWSKYEETMSQTYQLLM